MVELHPISPHIFKNPNSDSNSIISPSNSSSLLQKPPLLPHLIYPPPPPTLHTIHPPLYSAYIYYPTSHFYPHPLSGPHPVAPDPRRSAFRGFTGGGRGHRDFHGCTSVKKLWKPKQSLSPVRVLGHNCTTLMIKNIPYHISRSGLIDMLEIHCRDQNETEENRFDFVYLPFDFKTGNNLGYAFVNFTTIEGATRLYNCWENKGWEGSGKIRKITRAKFQGTHIYKNYFQISEFRCRSEDYLPVSFSPARDGSNGGVSTMMVIGTWIFS